MFQCSDTVRSTDILGNIVELNKVKIGTTLHDTLSYYAALLRAMLYYIKVHYTVLHSTILSYPILFYPILSYPILPSSCSTMLYVPPKTTRT